MPSVLGGICFAIKNTEVVTLNDENLIPQAHKLTVEEQSKGGKASGISRNFKGALKKRLKDNPETMDNIIEALVNQAESGNVKAVECLIDLNGESVQRESLRIKSKELKLKEKSLQNTGPEFSKEEPLLYNALESDDT